MTAPRQGAEPRRLYQAFLADVTATLLAGDLERSLDYYALPHRIVMLDRTMTCVTRADMLRCLAGYIRLVHSRGVTTVRRTADDARFLSDDEMVGFHITTHLRDGAEVLPAYAAQFRLRRVERCWRLAEQEGVVYHETWRFLPDPDAAMPRQDERREQ